MLDPVDRKRAWDTVNGFHESLQERLAVSSRANCPVDFTAAFVGLAKAQSCGKCVPCRIGLAQIDNLLQEILDGYGSPESLELLQRTAQTLYDSADCAIGFETGRVVLAALKGFGDDFSYHIQHDGRCGLRHSEAIPCMSGCPANVDIPGYLALVAAGRNADAMALIRHDNPLPIACGLICEHPCELRCRRGMVDGALNIRGIKRYASENAPEAGVSPEALPKKAQPTGKKVAVVGAGPAGLSAAYFLSLMGHEVSIFEQRQHLGGMMRYGIPAYRLPRERLQAEIDWILSLGIQVRTGVSVPADISLEQLRADFDAVYLAIGAHAGKKLGIEGEDAQGVMSAVEMLRGIGDGQMPDFSGEEIVVVGGGNVAMDVARSSVRLGAKKVSIVYRRRASDMTAQPEEIEGALAEGCALLELHAPVSVATQDGKVCGLVVKPQVIGPVVDGRPKPLPALAPEFTIPADRILVAIGQDIDTAAFAAKGLSTKRGALLVDKNVAVKSLEGFERFDGVFAGGDCVSGPATVIKAIAAAKEAARAIDSYLGFKHVMRKDVQIPPAVFGGSPSCARSCMAERDAASRCHDFDIVEQGLSDQAARQEAFRCLRCDKFGFASLREGRTQEW